MEELIGGNSCSDHKFISVGRKTKDVMSSHSLLTVLTNSCNVPYNVVRGETHVYDGKVESKWWAMPQGHRASRQAHGASPISVGE